MPAKKLLFEQQHSKHEEEPSPGAAVLSMIFPKIMPVVLIIFSLNFIDQLNPRH